MRRFWGLRDDYIIILGKYTTLLICSCFSFSLVSYIIYDGNGVGGEAYREGYCESWPKIID
jgi:hypothetical protein